MRVIGNSAKVVVLICTSVAALQMHSVAQSSSAEWRTGTLNGTVIDSSIDARVVNASVMIEGKHIRRVVASDEEGRFEVELPAGNYRITVTQSGFATFRLKNIKIRIGSTTTLDVPLKIAGIGPCPDPKHKGYTICM